MRIFVHHVRLDCVSSILRPPSVCHPPRQLPPLSLLTLDSFVGLHPPSRHQHPMTLAPTAVVVPIAELSDGETRATAPTLQPSLTISHHDECLVFPGYHVTVGKGYVGQGEEHGKNPYTARNHVDKAEFPIEGQSMVDVVWYKKHRRKLVVAVIIWFAAFLLISLPLHRTSDTQSSHRVNFFTP